MIGIVAAMCHQREDCTSSEQLCSRILEAHLREVGLQRSQPWYVAEPRLDPGRTSTFLYSDTLCCASKGLLLPR